MGLPHIAQGLDEGPAIVQLLTEPLDPCYFGPDPGGGYGEINDAKPLPERWHRRLVEAEHHTCHAGLTPASTNPPYPDSVQIGVQVESPKMGAKRTPHGDCRDGKE